MPLRICGKCEIAFQGPEGMSVPLYCPLCREQVDTNYQEGGGTSHDEPHLRLERIEGWFKKGLMERLEALERSKPNPNIEGWVYGQQDKIRTMEERLEALEGRHNSDDDDPDLHDEITGIKQVKLIQDVFEEELRKEKKNTAAVVGENSRLRTKIIPDLRDEADFHQRKASEIQNKYNELIYQVGSAYPDETRHQTALRYIRQQESSISSGPAATNQET